jgi:hypothetical protein
MSSAEAPSAAVRTMIPPPFGSRFLTISAEAVSAQHPRAAWHAGAFTVRTDENRPGSEISAVRRAPLDFTSLTACMRIVRPR